MLEDVRGYLQMAAGLTEVTAAKARIGFVSHWPGNEPGHQGA